MSVIKNLLDTVVLLGALQGFIVSVLLFRVKQNSNRLIGSLLFLFSLACLYIFLMESGVFNIATFWIVFEAVIPMIILMPVGPLIYFYAKATINPAYALNKKDTTHFYPVALDLLPSLLAIFYISGTFLGLLDFQKQAIWGNFIDNYNRYVDIPRWISITVYTWASWKLIQFHKAEQKQMAQFKWLKQLVFGFCFFQLIWLSYLIPYLAPSMMDKLLDTVSWYPIYIPLSIMIYWLGINGYFIRREQVKNLKSNRLSSKEIEDCIRSLGEAMVKDQLYLEPTLSLNKLVNYTGINQKTISAVLNQHLDKSFNIFINEYRINEVKKRLIDPKNNHLTLTGIAFESGFNSQATFQRVFRQSTGQSPKEFRDLYLKK